MYVRKCFCKQLHRITVEMFQHLWNGRYSTGRGYFGYTYVMTNAWNAPLGNKHPREHIGTNLGCFRTHQVFVLLKWTLGKECVRPWSGPRRTDTVLSLVEAVTNFRFPWNRQFTDQDVWESGILTLVCMLDVLSGNRYTLTYVSMSVLLSGPTRSLASNTLTTRSAESLKHAGLS